MPKGRIYFVGAGPGDPGLVTLKGIEALKQADVVIYDFLANERLLGYAKEGVEAVYAGKKGRFKHISQERINSLIVRHAKQGKTVVRLKGGDPFIFGRGAEEALAAVRNGIPFEVIPGVTSAVAAPAYAGIPLTHRDFASSVTFLTGQESPEKDEPSIEWDKLSQGEGTLVILMGWKNLKAIVQRLLEGGRPPETPVAMIRWGTLPKQKCITGRLDNIVEVAEKEAMLPPVITVVGDIVGLREDLNWFETKPLFGRRILVTRTSEQAGAFTEILAGYGADPIAVPTIRTVPPADWKELDMAIRRISRYDWAIFTSINGVRYFFDRVYELGHDLRILKGVKICAIGPATARAVKERGINVDLVPGEYRAEAVITALGKRRIRGRRFLLPRALKAREVLPEEIKRCGGKIDVVTAYRTVKPRKEAARIRELLESGGVDVVTFTSSSTVSNFASIFKKGELKELLRGVRVACIGPITAATAREKGLCVDIMPERYTIPALAEAIADHFGSHRDG